ncbi:amidohydrolase [Caproiciproducens sp.]
MNFDFSYVDVAFINGKVVTVDKEDRIAQAVGVKGNRIVFVGSNEDLEQIIDEKTKIIDLKGRSLLPGFVDSHFHAILGGLFGTDEAASIIDVSYRNCKSIAQLLETVKKAITERTPGAWVSMVNFDPALVDEKRWVTLEELDSVAPGNPVQCMDRGHGAVYNSKAFATIGVFNAEDAKRFPSNELIVENGKLTGLTKDQTTFLLWSKVDYTQKQQYAAALKSNKVCLEHGITSIHDPGACDAPSYKAMQKLCRERTFKPRTYMMLHSIYGKPYSYSDNEHFLSLGLTTGLGDNFFKIGTCKFMIDGGTSTPSCAVRQPYSHDPELPYTLGWERQEVADYIKRINDAGCQATAHAIGDLAVEYMVEGYEKAFESNPRPELRHRIEHTSLTDQNLIDRMAKLELCPTCHVSMLSDLGKSFTSFFGSERMKYMFALRSMLDAGLKVCINSDSPSGPCGMSVIDAAVNRVDRMSDFQVDQTQCISVLEGIRAYTLHGAYAAYEEKIKGSIETGKLADLIVLSEDILTYPKEDIYKIAVDMTMIDGVIEYER